MIKNHLVFFMFVSLVLFLLTTGCSSVQVKPDITPAKRSVEDYVKDDVDYTIKAVYDPWEGFNRVMYKFNAQFDNYVFLPVLGAYKFIMPDFAETGVSNFFNNIDEVFTLANSMLQLKAEKSFQTAGRFILNSTIGILGLIDVATPMGIPVQDEDFGQTLGYYGVGQGPYFVVPFLGPSNLRDFTGTVTETVAFMVVDPFNFDQNSEYEIPYMLLDAIDTRNQVSFRYYMTGSPFEYEMVRLLYDKARKVMIDN